MPTLVTDLDPETGHLILTVAGDEGAVCVAAWYEKRRPSGVLVAHSPRPLCPGHRPYRCCGTCGRTCYIIVSEKDGMVIAGLLLARRHEEAEQEALRCYKMYLCQEGAARR